LNLEGPDFDCKNLHSILKISYAGCLGLSPAISAQFTLEKRVAARNREKFTKTPYLGEGSRSFKVIDVHIPKKLVASRSVLTITWKNYAWLQPKTKTAWPNVECQNRW